MDTSVAVEHLDTQKQFITFAVGDAEYGIEIISVREIKAWTQTTNLPNADEYMRGVINLRGAIVPIYDLRALFGHGQTEPTKNHVVVIVAIEDRTIGVLVDAVSDIVSLFEGDIQDSPNSEGSSNFVSGLAQVSERMIMLLCPQSLINISKQADVDLSDFDESAA